jgi:hypothetical protein
MMAGISNLDVLTAQATTLKARTKGPYFMMPEDMALVQAFGAALEDECATHRHIST